MIDFSKEVVPGVVVKSDCAERAVPVLCHNQMLALNLFHLAVLVANVFFVGVNKHYQVGVLFDRTGAAQVRELWLASSSLNRAGELGESDDRDIELASQVLE